MRKGKKNLDNKFKRPFKKKHKKIVPGVTDAFSKKQGKDRGIVFPLSSNPWPKYIECCLQTTSEYTYLNQCIVGAFAYNVFYVYTTPYQPWNNASLTSGVMSLNPSFSATENALGFLDMISTPTIGSTSGGLYMYFVPLSAKLTATFVVGVQADAFTCLIYPAKSNASQPTHSGFQNVLSVPGAVQKSFKEFSGTNQTISCSCNVARQWGINKQEVCNDLGVWAGTRLAQPNNNGLFYVCIQSDLYTYQNAGTNWPTNATGLAMKLHLQTWVRFTTRANEYLAT